MPRWRAEPTLRAAASLGVSLSVLALGGLILNYLGGLRALPWALLLVVIVARLLASGRACGGPATPRSVRFKLPVPGVLSVLAVVLGLSGAGAGLALAFHPVSADRAVGFSELWIDTGAATDSFGVGVGNQEHRAVDTESSPRSSVPNRSCATSN